MVKRILFFHHSGFINRRNIIFVLLNIFLAHASFAEDGYEAWLRYRKISDADFLAECREVVRSITMSESHPTLDIAAKELSGGMKGMTGVDLIRTKKIENGSLIIGTINSSLVKSLSLQAGALKSEGFLIRTIKTESKRCIVITSPSMTGVLYGAFHFLRIIQTSQSVENLNLLENPAIDLRMLNHWDNLDGHVERGYAGQSIWRWHELPEVISPRYADYARFNASIGINGTVLTNVNANADILTTEYLNKVKALADIFRPYGIKVYLTARFNAPVQLDSLSTADPLDGKVMEWWAAKIKEIYDYIPDFGGFVVKANSEGQPGPREYGRTHADGANMLAKALKPYGGIVMWRAFVYSNEQPEDRAKQAYSEFLPLDGQFEENVLVQTKNGPIDFQPREPFHPLFGAMKKTPLMLELQITQEYLGQGLHLCYLAPLFKECLDADTYAKGKASYVSKAVDGTLYQNKLTGIAGVSNIGSDRNWTGHPFGQSNWFAFGRLAWNHSLTSEAIAKEWVKMTFGHDSIIVGTITEMMLISREAEVNFSMPLGLHHQMAWHHHYGPGPWIRDKERADWTSVYYHKAGKNGIGFDRTFKGSNAVSQYSGEVRDIFNDVGRCPENLLLWFHHVSWDHRMKSKKTLWEELCFLYDLGAEQVKDMQRLWKLVKNKVDDERFDHVESLLKIQLSSAEEWRGACVLYFQTFSGKPLPSWFRKPDKTLIQYRKREYKYLPGS